MKPNSSWAIVVAVTASVVAFAVVFYSIRCGLRETAASPTPTEGPLPLEAVRSWALQIQDVDAQGAVDALAASQYDLIVVEPTRTDWSEPATRNFDTAEMVSRLKGTAAHDGVHRKLVLAFINIGEAEAWRWYWTWTSERDSKAPRPANWPSFVLEPDLEDAGGDHPVAFWENAWKNIVLYGPNHQPGQTVPANATPPPGHEYVSLIDEALRDGFDGVYLDWVEAYADQRVAGAAKKAVLDPAAEMARFLGEIRAYTQARNPKFVIVQSNASDLIADHPETAAMVDAIAQEGIWFSGSTDADWPDPTGYDQPAGSSDSDEVLANLKLYRKAGKPVFDLEYAVGKAKEAAALSRASGLVPYCSRAALNQLSAPPPE